MSALRRLLLSIILAVALHAGVGSLWPALADELSDLVAALGSESFGDKEKAIDGLGTLGDGRAIPALKALADGKLYTSSDKRTVIVEPSGSALVLLDPVTGAKIGEAASASEVERVRVNNRLRGTIAAALSKLSLFSADRDERLAAARDAMRHGSAESAAVLEKALVTEADPEVKAAIQLSLYGALLKTGSKAQRITAIRSLADAGDPQVRGLLGELQGASDTEPEVREAAASALVSIDRRLQFVGLAANLFQGVSLGSVLLLAAIGLAITFGVMGVINMAHGEMIMLGAYSAYVVQELFRAFLPASLNDLYLIVALPVAFAAAGAVGIVLERGIIRFLYGRPLETMLATWGISLILQQVVRSIFGAPNKEVANPSWMTGGFTLTAGFDVTWNRLIIIVFCFAVLALLAAVLRHTSFGLRMRAVTQNREMAAVMGIPTGRVDALTFGLGSGIAGIAGVALSQIGNVSPNLGQLYIVDSFLVVVFGGVGNLMGTLVGAMGLGIVNKFLEPVAGAVLGKIVVLVAVILFIQRRPRGLFALKGRTAAEA
jgi:urea transport system permease protein